MAGQLVLNGGLSMGFNGRALVFRKHVSEGPTSLESTLEGGGIGYFSRHLELIHREIDPRITCRLIVAHA
jgi:hypothetical protein